MKPDFTDSGVEVQTFDEILDGLVTEYKNIYGSDIDLEQNTPDGQKVGIEAKLSLDLQTFLLSLYNNFDPDLSGGEILNKVIKLAGMTAGASTQSAVVIDVTATGNTTLESGFTVSDGSNDWLINSDLAILTGTTPVTFYAEKFGNITASPATITDIKSVNAFVSSVNNPLAATAGIDAETDQEIRNRRQQSVQNPAYSTAGSLTAKLLDLPGVNDVRIYENKTSVYDVTLALNPHSIWCVIEDGIIADIAKTIALNRTAGAGMKGDLESSLIETFARSDNSTFDYIHDIKYDIPIINEVTITVTATKFDPLVPVDIDLLKEKIAKKTYHIGDDCIATELYEFGYNAGKTFFLKDMTVDAGEKIDGIAGAKFNIDVSNITVTEL